MFGSSAKLIDLTRSGGRLEIVGDTLSIDSHSGQVEICLSEVASSRLAKSMVNSAFTGQLELIMREGQKYTVNFSQAYEKDIDYAKGIIEGGKNRVRSGLLHSPAASLDDDFHSSSRNAFDQFREAQKNFEDVFNRSQSIFDRSHEIFDRTRSKATLPPENSSSAADELERWAELRGKGIITEEEFNFKKKRLLYGTEDNLGQPVKEPCKYCGMLVETTDERCDSCGAPIK